MSEKTEGYKKQIAKTIFSGSKQQQKISEILKQMEADKELTDDEKLLIESQVTQINIPLASNDNNESESSKKSERLFPKYDLDDDFKLPCGVKEFGFDENCNDIARQYGRWLRDVYLPTFVQMPDSEHQYPIAVSLMLLNCQCVSSKKMDIPIPYFLGNRGSGKTELSKSIRQHYPDHLALQFMPADTGASICERLDNSFRGKEVSLSVFDNFNPSIFVVKAMDFYQVLLATNKEDSIRRKSAASNDEGKSEWETYCYKILTSVFDLASEGKVEFGEMYRRMLTLKFKNGTPMAKRIAYDWEAQQRIFQRIWGEAEMPNIKRIYAKALRDMVRLSPNEIPNEIPSEQWAYCIVPIAVGNYCGIWESVEDGIAHFARHFKYLKGDNSGVGSMLSKVLTKYIKEELPKVAASNRTNRYASEVSKLIDVEIPQDALKKELTTRMGFDVGRRDMDEIIMLMANFGYTYERLGTAMGFVKQQSLKKE
ncbi:hypothetical protein GTQ43_17940 [Nostoc sp. KVJ3]|uniref:hypothetical protein n=1 Tax=Nostoc sp. KVJ3 TaxID=457945 RepID=UPI0022374AC1|nr:hypothetical protein [Nostoc sp. KVJ3]MCW5315623.1 hypothetical protein [Nostoc sp. KVJ3]